MRPRGPEAPRPGPGKAGAAPEGPPSTFLSWPTTGADGGLFNTARRLVAGGRRERGGCEVEVPHEPMKERGDGPRHRHFLSEVLGKYERGAFVDVTSTKLNGLYAT